MTEQRSSKRSEVYKFIKSYVADKGYPPSVREICAAVGLRSTSTVHRHLENLEKSGLIKRDSTKPRTIEIIENSSGRKEMINIPIIGTIAAGTPILAVENIEDTFPLPIDYVKNTNQLFMLKIHGESMADVGILDEDFAILEQNNSANNGDIVADLIGNDATLKRFFKEEDHIRLQPENKTMDPIIVPDCTIIGKLVGIYRRY